MAKLHTVPRLAITVLAIAQASCAVQPEAAESSDEAVGTQESALFPIAWCVGPTARPQTAGVPFSERVDLFGVGDRSDFAWSEATLSSPSSLRPRVTVTSTVDVAQASIELNIAPLTGWVAGGVNLLLEVVDGARVLCSQKLKLVEGSTPAGEKNGSAARGARTLSCSFDSTGLTRAPVARTSLEAWATVAGLGTAYVRGSGSTPRVEESKCMSLPVIP